MNRYTLRFFILLAAFGLLAGCSKAVLNTTPYSFDVLTTYKTAQDAELALTGCYSVLNAQTIQGQGALSGLGPMFAWAMPIMLSGGTDELLTNPKYAQADLAPLGLIGASSGNQAVRYNWFFLFAGINRANYIIQGVGSVSMDTVRRSQILAEAHFLRGLYYMYVGMMYGAAPVSTTPTVDLNAKRDSVSKLFNLVISDFQVAYTTLPSRATTNGRANKWSAAGFLAKVYTYLASCKTNNVGQSLNFPLNSFNWVDAGQMYSNALTVTNAIISGSGYKLIPNYDYLFRETTLTDQLQESLFSVLSSGNPAAGNFNCWLPFETPTGNVNLAGGGYGYFRPPGEMYKKYDTADLRFKHNLTFSVANTNPKETIGGVTYYVPTAATAANNALLNVAKWRDEDPVSNSKPIALIETMGALTILRYADILLLNAEAKYFTGDESGARAMLQAVRQRSVVSSANLSRLTTMYLKDFPDELIDERSRELCFEGWRRIDLVRFGLFKSAIMGLSTTAGYFNSQVPLMQQNLQMTGGDGRIWYPIPVTDIDLDPALVQNPGY
ncbi:MAG TPA: RagB/SusD family nutrient uptake outer membrane protein [Puia sp.]|jgi:hypothetical protein